MRLFRFLNFALFVFLFLCYALNKESPCSFSAAFFPRAAFMHSCWASCSPSLRCYHINNHKVVDMISTYTIHQVYSTIVSSQYSIVLLSVHLNIQNESPLIRPQIGGRIRGLFFWPADAIRPLIRPLNRGLIIGIRPLYRGLLSF